MATTHRRDGRELREVGEPAPDVPAQQPLAAARAERRVQTGVSRLDAILQGGLLRGGIYTFMGPPGSGKTILANQVCFHHIKQGKGSCVYFTLLIESHAKLFAHLSSLDFFDPSVIPDRVYYVSGYSALREGGFAALADLIRKTIKARGATIAVIDGLESAEHAAPDLRAFREFIHELQSTTGLFDCTTILLTNVESRAHVENSLVDGVIELSDMLVGPRAVRELTVHKLRGGPYLRGRHELEIGSSGLVVHPRLEVQFDHPPARATEKRIRMAFGVPKFDEMLMGGVPSGSMVALLGSPGTGKTMLGLSFLLEGAKRGQKGTYFGFHEPPPRLIEKAREVGMDLEKHVRSGGIELIWQPPLEHRMDALSEQLLERFREDPAPRRRLFIDTLGGFRAAAVYADRMPRFLSALANQLRSADVTSVIADEIDLFSRGLALRTPELAEVAETVVMLRYVELRSQLYRLISIMKMRESGYDTAIREFVISDNGIEVAGSFESAEAILSGQPIAPRKRPRPARSQSARRK